MTSASFHDWCVRDDTERRASRPALRFEGGELTFAQFDAKVRAREATLLAKGISPGCVAALRFASQFELALTSLALMSIGAPFIAIPRSLTPQQADHWIAESKSAVLLTDGSAGDGESMRTEVLSAAADAVAAGAAPTHPPVQDGDVVMIIGGSGSTGRSKLIPVTQAQMRNRVLDTIETLALTEADRSFGLVHLEYASAMHRLLAVLKSGGCMILQEVRIAQAAEFIASEGATVVSSTAVHAEQLTRHARSQPGHKPLLPKVRLMTIAGSTVSEPLRRAVMETLTPNLWVGYGTNECWYATAASPGMIRSTPGTIGKASSRSQLRLVDESGHEVPAGEVGLIEIRSDSVSPGYLDNRLPENRAFRDGWFRPGDLGRGMPDGQVVFCGRADNMMIYNGINIFPVEIENCVLAFPGVAEAVAFPARHPVFQDVPLCAFSLDPGSGAEVAALTAHVKSRLGFRAPRALIRFPKLPRTAQGKIDVREVARRVAAMQDRKT
jgi:acyl-coenzyme A synthetase/AMP-(fatty) acid ligase